MKRRSIIFALLFALAIASCEKPPAPAPVAPTPKPKPIICIVPGLGDPQTGDVYAMLTQRFPQANVIDFGTAKNSYLTDLKGYVLANPHSKLITIAHSYGTDKVNQVIAELGPVALDVKLDPVPEKLFGRYTITPNVTRTMVITGDFSGLFRAGVDGSYEEYKVHRPHSAMAHDPATLSLVNDAVAEALR